MYSHLKVLHFKYFLKPTSLQLCLLVHTCILVHFSDLTAEMEMEWKWQVSRGCVGKFWLEDITAGAKGPAALMGEVLNVNTFIYFCAQRRGKGSNKSSFHLQPMAGP